MLRFEGNLVGMRFRPPALDIVANLPLGTRLLARRQPENPHDENAIQIFLDEALFKENKLAGDPAMLLNKLAKEYSWQDRYDPECWELPVFLGYINRDAAAVISGQLDQDGILEVPCTFQTSMTGQPQIVVELLNEAKRALGGEPSKEQNPA